MKEHYAAIRVKERTKQLARELAAKNNMQIKDFIQLTLEMRQDENEKKKKPFGFKF